MRKLLLLIALACSACASHQSPPWETIAARSHHPFGYYSGQVEARWENDGRTMTLLTELRYTDPDGVVWIAPAGSTVDGASIPRALWSLMGGPFEGKYRNASVLHDVAYDEHVRRWQDCDRMFYHAMRCSGVGAVEAKTMYYALYRHGRHWKLPRTRRALALDEEMPERRALVVNDEEEMSEARSWIKNANPSLEQIEARADAQR